MTYHQQRDSDSRINPQFTCLLLAHTPGSIFIFLPMLVKSSRIWKEPSSQSRRWLRSFPRLLTRPLLPHSTSLPWLNGVRRLQASATCFLTVSSVTASENSAATCFFPFFIGRAGPGSAGRFPFISSPSTDPRQGSQDAISLQKLQFPKCPSP